MIDIDLVRGGGGQVPIVEWLRARDRRFEVQPSGRAATYHHPDTGVTARLALDDRRVRTRLAVRRPTYWGTEVAGVLERMGRACGLLSDGRPVLAEAVRKRFDVANRSAWSTAPPEPERIVLPDGAVASWWRWNVAREEVQALYPAAFVPHVKLVEWDGAFRTAAIWTDLCPIVLPPVEVVLVLCAALVTRGLPAGLVGVCRDEVESLTGPIPSGGRPVPDASDRSEWETVVRRGSPAVGKPRVVHPEDGVEESLAGRRTR